MHLLRVGLKLELSLPIFVSNYFFPRILLLSCETKMALGEPSCLSLGFMGIASTVDPLSFY